MSGPLAIAAVSAVLRELLRAGAAALNLGGPLGGDVLVSVTAPDRVPLGETATTQLNLFLYNVVRNPGWANKDLPSRDARGERISNPALGLDLYYLLTAYGVGDFHAEILLGGAAQVMHDTPGLGREAIRTALDTGLGVPAELREAGLSEQIEALKISPVPMPTDEISRLWAAMNVSYRPSLAYLVSVVLLEPKHSTRSALPVRERLIYAVPFREVRVDRVVSADGPGFPIGPDSLLRILGRNLGNPELTVTLNGIDVTLHVVSRTNDELRLQLSLPQAAPLPPLFPAGLRAGPCSVELRQALDMGQPLVAHEGFRSNIVPFVLTPSIVVAAAAGSVDVTCSPKVGASQRARLLLNEKNAAPGAIPRAYSFDAPHGNGIVAPATETAVVNVPIRNIAPGAYLARVQIDGAESALIFNPAIGRFDRPEVVIP